MVLALGLVGWFYFFTIKTAAGFKPNGDFDYYNLLVEAFRVGQVHLPVEPDPRFIALPDPYDPRQSEGIRLPDASYYRGKYYLYFGPTPTLLMWPYTALTGRHMPQGAAIFVFCALGLAAATFLWLEIKRRFFPETSWWWEPLGVLGLGFGTHVLSLARRPLVWELPIAASFAFTMVMLFGIARAVQSRRSAAWMGFVGVAAGLAIVSRPTLVLAAVGILAPLVFLWKNRARRDAIIAATMAALGLAIVLLPFLAYNYARFDSPFEFGQSYQLTGVDQRKSAYFSLTYFLHNLRLYYFWPADFTAEWPFISARVLPHGPEGHLGGEQIYGLAWFFPLVWCGAIWVWNWQRGSRVLSPELKVVIVAVASVFVAMSALMLCCFYAAERYMVDFTPALMILALSGALLLESRLRCAGRIVWRRIFAIAAGVGAIVTIGFGALISFDYHWRLMRKTDPATWRTIAGAFASAADWWHGGKVEVTGREVTFMTAPMREPEILMTFGSGEGQERIWLMHESDGALKLGWSRGERAVQWGTAVPVRLGQVVRARFYVPTLAQSEMNPRRRFWCHRAVLLELDDKVVLAKLVGIGADAAGDPAPAPQIFTGVIRREDFRTLEISHFFDPPGVGIAKMVETPRLLLRCTLPVAEWGEVQPLLSWGRKGAAHLVGLRRVSDRSWELVFQRSAGPPASGSRFSAAIDDLVTLTFELPRRDDADPHVVVRVNGAESLRAASDNSGFNPNELVLSRNEWNFSSVEPVFTGWIVEFRDWRN